jgi:hypothetical protein
VREKTNKQSGYDSILIEHLQHLPEFGARAALLKLIHFLHRSAFERYSFAVIECDKNSKGRGIRRGIEWKSA